MYRDLCENNLRLFTRLLTRPSSHSRHDVVKMFVSCFRKSETILNLLSPISLLKASLMPKINDKAQQAEASLLKIVLAFGNDFNFYWPVPCFPVQLWHKHWTCLTDLLFQFIAYSHIVIEEKSFHLLIIIILLWTKENCLLILTHKSLLTYTKILTSSLYFFSSLVGKFSMSWISSYKQNYLY